MSEEPVKLTKEEILKRKAESAAPVKQVTQHASVEDVTVKVPVALVKEATAAQKAVKNFGRPKDPDAA